MHRAPFFLHSILREQCIALRPHLFHHSAIRVAPKGNISVAKLRSARAILQTTVRITAVFHHIPHRRHHRGRWRGRERRRACIRLRARRLRPPHRRRQPLIRRKPRWCRHRFNGIQPIHRRVWFASLREFTGMTQVIRPARQQIGVDFGLHGHIGARAVLLWLGVGVEVGDAAQRQ